MEFTFVMVNATFEHYLNMVRGVNTITVRSEDEYGNRNVTAPYVVDVREEQEHRPFDSTTLYVLVLVLVAVAMVLTAYVLLRKRP